MQDTAVTIKTAIRAHLVIIAPPLPNQALGTASSIGRERAQNFFEFCKARRRPERPKLPRAN